MVPASEREAVLSYDWPIREPAVAVGRGSVSEALSGVRADSSVASSAAHMSEPRCTARPVLLTQLSDVGSTLFPDPACVGGV